MAGGTEDEGEVDEAHWRFERETRSTIQPALGARGKLTGSSKVARHKVLSSYIACTLIGFVPRCKMTRRLGAYLWAVLFEAKRLNRNGCQRQREADWWKLISCALRNRSATLEAVHLSLRSQ